MAPTKKEKHNNSPPPPGQKSLTSFFGAPRSSKTGQVVATKKVQSTIKGSSIVTKKNDDGKKKKKSEEASSNGGDGGKAEEEVRDFLEKMEDRKKKGDTTSKENVVNSDEKKKAMTAANEKTQPAKSKSLNENDDLMDTDDDEKDSATSNNNDGACKKKKKKDGDAGGKGKKRVIDDSDSDESGTSDVDREMKDEEEYNEEEGEEEEEEEEEEPATLMESPPIKRIAKNSAAATSKSSSSSSPKAKKQKTLTGKKLVISNKKKPTGKKSSVAIASQMKSNSQLRILMSNEMDPNDAKIQLWGSDNNNGKSKSSSSTTMYSALCTTFTNIEEVSGRLVIQEMLTELFRKVLLMDGGGCCEDDGADDESEDEEMGAATNGNDDGDGKKKKAASASNNKKGDNKADSRSDLYTLLYLTSNSVAPKHDNVELGVGDSILIKAIGEASGTTPAMIKQKYDKEGDLGNVAMTAKGKQKTLVGFGKISGPKRLSCNDVLKVFKEIADTSGNSAQKFKSDKIKSLLVRAKGCEPRFIIRGVQGKLRIGVSSTTVLACLAHAIVLTKPKGVVDLSEERLAEIRMLEGDEAYPDTVLKLCGKKKLPLDEHLEAAVAIVKRAYNEVPSYDTLLDALLTVPLQEIHKICKLSPGVPVGPMLAKPTKSVQEVLKRLNGLRFTCEYKYDGERAQVHMLSNGETKVFSRNLLNTSEKFPEVPLYVQESCKTTSVTSFVLDTEVVAYDRETKQFVPFQVLSTRKRTEESAESAKVTVIVQAFDLMFLNGESLLDKTLAERRDLMKKNFLPVEGKFQYATSLDHDEDGDTTVLEEFLDAAVKGQCEGLMVKTLDVNAAYQPDQRSLNWLKLKKDYLEGLGDSVDLVPLGAYHGKGKRTGVYGAYLLACYDEDTEEFQSVCKIGTGFSDEDLKELSASLNKHVIPNKSSQYNVSDTMKCDVWFDAVQVWEVKAADLSKSSTHKGAVDKTGEAGRGIGLRFPRFERVRPDKKPDEATSSDQILDMYYAQDSVVEGGGGGGDDMDGI